MMKNPNKKKSNKKVTIVKCLHELSTLYTNFTNIEMRAAYNCPPFFAKKNPLRTIWNSSISKMHLFETHLWRFSVKLLLHSITTTITTKLLRILYALFLSHDHVWLLLSVLYRKEKISLQTFQVGTDSLHSYFSSPTLFARLYLCFFGLNFKITY